MRRKSIVRGLLAASLAGNAVGVILLWKLLSPELTFIPRQAMNSTALPRHFEQLRSRLVRFYPVCFDGEYRPLPGKLTRFARGWFLSVGLPTLVDRKGRIWVPRKFHWARDQGDVVLNWSGQAARDAYERKHGRQPTMRPATETCTFYRRWLLKQQVSMK